MKIRQVGAELFHVDGQIDVKWTADRRKMDRQTDGKWTDRQTENGQTDIQKNGKWTDRQS